MDKTGDKNKPEIIVRSKATWNDKKLTVAFYNKFLQSNRFAALERETSFMEARGSSGRRSVSIHTRGCQAAGPDPQFIARQIGRDVQEPVTTYRTLWNIHFKPEIFRRNERPQLMRLFKKPQVTLHSVSVSALKVLVTSHASRIWLVATNVARGRTFVSTSSTMQPVFPRWIKRGRHPRPRFSMHVRYIARDSHVGSV